MSCKEMNERNMLKFSTFSCFCFAVFGIGFGIWLDSLLIVFDGAYSLISLALSLLALFATIYIQKLSENKQKNNVLAFKQKTALIEALVVLIKGLVISLICLVSFISAMDAMFSGGREVNADFALLFGIVNVAGCLVTYRLIKKQLGLTPSAILLAESKQWLMDTVISAAVLIGFLVTSVLIMAGFSKFAVYADPFMVILASLYFISVPLKMIKESVGNLVLLSHDKENRKKAVV